ncbi:MAG: isoprenylcysteine carboxylmethyltransferase family protein [Pseudomonadota bacterium]
MTEDAYEDRPRTMFSASPIFVGALAVGYVMRLFFGGALPFPRAFSEGVGELMVLIALAVFGAAVSTFASGGETLRPDTPSRQLFTTGPYRYSRNPAYLAMMLFGVGFGIATGNLWTIMATLGGGVLMTYFVIKPEERYLEDKFGDDYTTYKNNVRRWI